MINDSLKKKHLPLKSSASSKVCFEIYVTRCPRRCVYSQYQCEISCALGTGVGDDTHHLWSCSTSDRTCEDAELNLKLRSFKSHQLFSPSAFHKLFKLWMGNFGSFYASVFFCDINIII